MIIQTYTLDRKSKNIIFNIEDVEFSSIPSCKHLLIIKGKRYKIQFYAPTWVFSNKATAIMFQNKNRGKKRTKRYNKLNKLKTKEDKLDYIIMNIRKYACYLIEL